ncbi:MAG: hypothetical protein JNK02_10425 [Planctomycetes bacterium]|nr:hypothetical protein [Planctomycetota bacterium]
MSAELRDMSIDEVLFMLRADGGTIGQTATPGSQYFEACCQLRFRLCECSRRVGPGYDYIARGPDEGIWYVGINGTTGVISCGPKGHHYLHGTPPCL